MTATINGMDYLYVDNLSADQLMENDLVEIGGEVVEIVEISSTKTGILLTYENEFGEKEIEEFSDDVIFKLFVVE